MSGAQSAGSVFQRPGTAKLKACSPNKSSAPHLGRNQ